MSEQMYIIVTLRKPIADREAGEIVYEAVKTKLADRPDIEINGHVTNHFIGVKPT